MPKKKNDQMLKTIGRLTLERDFLQGVLSPNWRSSPEPHGL